MQTRSNAWDALLKLMRCDTPPFLHASCIILMLACRNAAGCRCHGECKRKEQQQSHRKNLDTCLLNDTYFALSEQARRYPGYGELDVWNWTTDANRRLIGRMGISFDATIKLLIGKCTCFIFCWSFSAPKSRSLLAEAYLIDYIPRRPQSCSYLCYVCAFCWQEPSRSPYRMCKTAKPSTRMPFWASPLLLLRLQMPAAMPFTVWAFASPVFFVCTCMREACLHWETNFNFHAPDIRLGFRR